MENKWFDEESSELTKEQWEALLNFVSTYEFKDKAKIYTSWDKENKIEND